LRAAEEEDGEEKMMEKRKEFFDRHAQDWDDRLQYEKKLSQLLEVVQEFELRKGYWVLDVGTGTGILLPLLRKAIGKEGKLFGMDFSFNMLNQAKERKNDAEGVFINGGVGAIPIRSHRFDRVTCFSAFPHFPNKVKALQEMVRVLKKDGKLFIAHLHSAEEINQFHRRMGGAVGQDFLPRPEEMQTLMSKSGLDEVSVVNQPGKFLAKGKKM
jgi:ubiquinone/menaquinone biosynthesis C-methylase UbiE